MTEKEYYSQFGEDKFLDEKCNLPEKGVFVDVGAGGIIHSNSYFFEKKGWECLCIEPDKRHPGLEKRKLVDNSLVGSKNGEVEFVFHQAPELNSLYLDKTNAVKLPIYTLDSLLEKHKIEQIDILSIDVEGNEIEVLKGFDILKYKPKYIVIEHTCFTIKGDKKKEIREILESANYKVVLTTQANYIFELQG